MPETKTECAILLDIENLLFSALGDAAAYEASKNKVVEQIIGAVSAIGRRHAPTVRSYAALGFARKQKEVSWIALVLAKAGFRTMIVPAGPNAADAALRDFGLLLSINNAVATVVLATGDGKEPFPELLELLLEAGKRVHVVSYDGAPWSMHAEGVEHSSLAPHLRLLHEEAALPPAAEARGFADDPFFCREAVRLSYRRAARAILNGASLDGLGRAARNLADAYELFEEELAGARDRRFSFGRLLGVLEAARAARRLKADSNEEVRWIAKTLVNFTDAFDRLELYAPNADGRFADIIKTRVTA